MQALCCFTAVVWQLLLLAADHDHWLASLYHLRYSHTTSSLFLFQGPLNLASFGPGSSD